MLMNRQKTNLLFPYEQLDSQSLTDQLVTRIRKLIFNGELEPGDRLPNEPDLAVRMSVSRSTLRTALQILEREGFLIRRRGIGTFVEKEPLKINNLNLNWGVTQVIESTGAVPGTIELLVVERPAIKRIAQKLRINEGDPLTSIERVRTADGRRVVFSVDHIPAKFLKTPNGQDISLTEIEVYLKENQSMYSFFSEKLALHIHHAVAWISPLSADKLVTDKLQIQPGSGILYIEQVDYSHDGDPYILADEYHVANAFTFSVYRSK